MAQPARRPEPARDDPPLDPFAIQRAYRRERARRRARLVRNRERRHADVRFLVVLVALFAASVFLLLTVWTQVQRLFGL